MPGDASRALLRPAGPRWVELEAELSEDEGFVGDDDVDAAVEREEDGMLVGR